MIRKSIIFILLLILVISCNSQKDIKVEQCENSYEVSLSKSLLNPQNDSLSLNFPIKIGIKNNMSVGPLRLEKMTVFSDLDATGQKNAMYSLTQKKKIYTEVKENIEHENFYKIIISYSISKEEAERIVGKYHVSKTTELKNYNDSIKIIPYKNFIKDNGEYKQRMDKTPDFVRMMFRDQNNKTFIEELKINW
ncbi:hypothetical protein [Chryseobacterium ureilyticum]|nr:hypothetical protein [Chryseobacterium ureilyticum]